MEFSKFSDEEIRDLIREDARLPTYIKPKKNQYLPKLCEIKEVLLTGVTGTLGPYILRELLTLPQVSKVICPVRPSKKSWDDDESLGNRLKKTLKERNLHEEIDMGKVKVIRGDVSERYFNFDDHLWEELINSTDAVIHCAAKINYLEKYNRKSAVRSVNLTATKNVLEFACSGRKLKHIFYSSSLLACGAIDKKEWRLAETWPNLEDFDGENSSNLAYPISKFVGELMIKEAVTERGIPAKIFRFPLVGGESKDGRMPTQGNVIFSVYLFALKNGFLLDNSFYSPILPVDMCAEAGIKLFFNDQAPNEIYNIFHGSLNAKTFLKLSLKLGYELNETYELSEVLKWMSSLSDNTSSLALLSSIASSYSGDEHGDSLPQYNVFPLMRYWDPDTMPNFFVSQKLKTFLPQFLKKLQPQIDYLEKDILYAKSQGWL